MPKLIGHDDAWSQFTADYESGRLHHAWLITGPKGLGKATLARQFATFLQITRRPETDLLSEKPDHNDTFKSDDDPVAHQIETNSHSDVRYIERSPDVKTGKIRKDISVSQIRDLITYFSQTSSTEGWRIAIIDAADDLNNSAGNALLKLLEEPPAKAVLFLVCHSPGRILPTIKSRCRTLKLRPLQPDAFNKFLNASYAELDFETRRILAGLSAGIPGQTVNLLRRDGPDIYRDMLELIKTAPEMDIAKLHGFCERVVGTKDVNIFPIVTMVIRAFTESVIMCVAGIIPCDDFASGDKELKMLLSRKASLERWTELWEKTIHRFERMEAVNLDRRQVLLGFFHDLNQLVQASK